ncbi:MAG: hypothetical protein ACJA1A_003318, partial [Saprospiraceae bacterium]
MAKVASINKVDIMKKNFIFMLIVILMGSCSKSESNKESLSTIADDNSRSIGNTFEYDQGMEPPRTGEPAPPSQNQLVDLQKQSKIIKDGSVTIEVDSLELAKRSIDSIVSATNAYFENEVYNGGINQHRYTLKIRIPSSEFETFLLSLERGGGKMINKSVNARNVTGEYIDLEIRLKNNQAYLTQYRRLLKRAKSIKEILEIEEKARGIESEIDAQLGRIKYINDQVMYSTLTLKVYQKDNYKNEFIEPTFLSRVWVSTKYGFSTMQEIVLGVIALWPLMILLGFAFVGRRLYKSR